MSEHTPGPWAVVEYGGDEVPNLVIHSDDKMRVCFMATPGSNGDPATIAADAKLIAAAPDLLDALKTTLVLLKVFTRESDAVAKAVWDAAEDAIASAEGTALNHEQR